MGSIAVAPGWATPCWIAPASSWTARPCVGLGLIEARLADILYLSELEQHVTVISWHNLSAMVWGPNRAAGQPCFPGLQGVGRRHNRSSTLTPQESRLRTVPAHSQRTFESGGVASCSSQVLPCRAEVYVRDGLGYEDEPDDLKVNLGEHLLRAVFSIAASEAWMCQGSHPSQCAPLPGATLQHICGSAARQSSVAQCLLWDLCDGGKMCGSGHLISQAGWTDDVLSAGSWRPAAAGTTCAHVAGAQSAWPPVQAGAAILCRSTATMEG